MAPSVPVMTTSHRSEPPAISLRPFPEGPGTTVAPVEDRDEISVLSLLNVLLRWRWLILIPSGLMLLYAIGKPIVTSPPPEIYLAETVLEIEGGSSSGAPVNPVAQALGLGGGGSTGFPYAKELNSRAFLTAMLDERVSFMTPGGVRTATLQEMSGVEGRTAKRRRELAAAWLLGIIGFSPAPDGTTHLYVRAAYPALAESLSYRLIDRLNKRIVQRRQARVARDRFYTLEIMRAMRDSVKLAEDRVAAFVLSNRGYSNSPHLQNELSRLNRDLSIRQQTYTSLVSQYETARVEEVRKTPSIEILDPPYVSDEVPRRSFAPASKDLVKVVFALMFTSLLAFAIEFVRAGRVRNPHDYEEFLRLRGETFGWARRIFRRRRRGDLSVR